MMPLIRNLKTGKESVVSKEQWQNMVDEKRSILFKLINSAEAKSQGKVVIPEKITEFQINRPERIALYPTADVPIDTPPTTSKTIEVPLDVYVTMDIKKKPTKK